MIAGVMLTVLNNFLWIENRSSSFIPVEHKTRHAFSACLDNINGLKILEITYQNNGSVNLRKHGHVSPHPLPFHERYHG